MSQHNGLYVFETDQEIKYTCAFRNITSYLPPVLGIYDLEIHDFDFYPEDKNPDVRKKQDDRIKPTIVELLDSFFTSNLRALLYMCDPSDGRGERQSLFKQWHRNIESTFIVSEMCRIMNYKKGYELP